MEDILINLTAFRLTLYIVLVSLSIISMARLFKKIPLFAKGITIAMFAALVGVALGTFSNSIEYRLGGSIMLTAGLLIWVIFWAIDFANYDKD